MNFNFDPKAWLASLAPAGPGHRKTDGAVLGFIGKGNPSRRKEKKAKNARKLANKMVRMNHLRNASCRS